MWYRYLIVLFLILALFSCKKEDLPDEVTERPELYISGDLNGGMLDISAGLDDYYMETYFSRDSSDVYDFAGQFRKLSETGDKGVVRFLLKNNQAGGEVTSESFKIGTYAYRSPIAIDTFYQVRFTSQAFGEAASGYFWRFGDGDSAFVSDPVHLYPKSDIHKYNVCLNIAYSGCTSQICSDVFLPEAACSTSFTSTDIGNLNYEYRGLSIGQPPFNYSWEFKNTGAIAASQDVDYCYKDSTLEEVCLTVVDANNCEAKVCRNILVGLTGLANCATNFTYSVDSIIQRSTTDFSTVVIEYVDQNGVTFSSLSENQPTSSIFEIEEIQNYEVDRKGNKTKRLKINAKCWLYSRDGQNAIEITVVDGSIALAHP